MVIIFSVTVYQNVSVQFKQDKKNNYVNKRKNIRKSHLKDTYKITKRSN